GHDHGGGLAAAALVLAQVETKCADRGDCPSTSDIEHPAVDPKLRSGVGLHPVQPDVLLVLHSAGGNQDANHAPRASPPLSGLGLSGDADHFSQRDPLYDVLSVG